MLSATLLDNLLNRGLPRSPRARQLCAQLEGRSLAIEIPDVARLRVSSTGQTLSVTRDAAPADAWVVGGPVSLLALGGPTAQAVLQRGDVTIGGDAELAQKFQELARLLRPDLEEELSLLVGDVPAHQLGRLARAGAAIRAARRAPPPSPTSPSTSATSARDLVPRNEGEQFLRGVDTLREEVDRLEARLQRLARRGRA